MIKKNIAMLGLLGAMLSGDMTTKNNSIKTKQPETEEQKKKRLLKAEVKINKANGLTQFFYGHNSVWALNEKSADKKAQKNNWI